MRPRIGVTGPTGRGFALWAFAALSLWLRGGRPRRITPPYRAEDFEGLDGLLIGGGDDIGATLYGAEPAPDIRIDPDRDRLELNALERLWATDLPILGICRGSQMINVYRGGTLHQDIYEVYLTAPRMRTPLPRKRVALEGGTRLREIVGAERIVVNAIHHQAVDRLGEGLRVAARDEHAIVQAVEDPSGPFRMGVQWHPEFLFYRRSHWRLFGAFVAAARRHHRARSAAMSSDFDLDDRPATPSSTARS